MMMYILTGTVSTHSRAEAAAIIDYKKHKGMEVSTHSRAEAAAALADCIEDADGDVSTHSRAEAAASIRYFKKGYILGFNTQPRGGGCIWTGAHIAKV